MSLCLEKNNSDKLEKWVVWLCRLTPRPILFSLKRLLEKQERSMYFLFITT